jgi:hypothetical protein
VQKAVQCSLGLFAIIAGLFLFAPEWVAVPQNFFAARGLPIMATMAMAGMIHFLRRAGWSPERLAPAPIRTMLTGIIVMQLVIQTALTVAWSSYRNDLSRMVAARSGVIPWDTASAILNPRQTYFRGNACLGLEC